MKFPTKRVFRIFFCIWKITEFMPTCLRGAVFSETQCSYWWIDVLYVISNGLSACMRCLRLSSTNICSLTYLLTVFWLEKITLHDSLFVSYNPFDFQFIWWWPKFYAFYGKCNTYRWHYLIFWVDIIAYITCVLTNLCRRVNLESPYIARLPDRTVDIERFYCATCRGSVLARAVSGSAV